MTEGGIDPFSAHRAETRDGRLDGPRMALLVIDMVRDFVDPDGAMPLPDADQLTTAVNALADAIRHAGGRVVWVRDEHEDLDDPEFKIRTPHCLAGTGGSELAAGFSFVSGDRDLIKHRYSAFYDTDLGPWLRDAGITSVVVCGVVTNICVRSTVHDAFFQDFDVTVVADACMATGPREHASTLYDIDTHFGRVRDVKQVCELLGGAAGR
jgi:ureidoacrylate peracid hydrolase